MAIKKVKKLPRRTVKKGKYGNQIGRTFSRATSQNTGFLGRRPKPPRMAAAIKTEEA